MSLKFQSLFIITGLVLCVLVHADEVVWKSGKNQYVTITGQNKFKNGNPPPNDHPVSLEASDITNALGQLQIWDKKFFGKNEINYVYATSQQRLLGRVLSTALKQAKPDEDIVFSVAGNKSGSSISFTGPTFTAGRAFYLDGKLNIIMGDYMRPRNKGDEAMAGQFGETEVQYTFTHGSRAGTTKVLSGYNFDKYIIKNIGVDHYTQDGKKRQDWFVIDVRAASDFVIAKNTDKDKSKGKGIDDEELRRETAKIARERREMRAEMARMRKEMQELANGGTSLDSVEDRITKLDQLLEKDLITQEEYDQKRAQILNEI